MWYKRYHLLDIIHLFFSSIGNADIQLGTDCESTSVPEFGMIQKLIVVSAAAAMFFYFRTKAIV